MVSSLINIENCYRYLMNSIFKLENTSCSILKVYKSLNELNFGDDPCNIGVCRRKRLQKSEILGIINYNWPGILPHLYSLLQNCQYFGCS